MTKADLADQLFKKVGLNQREAKDMVEAFFEEIRRALERGDGVKLSGLGSNTAIRAERAQRRSISHFKGSYFRRRKSAQWH